MAPAEGSSPMVSQDAISSLLGPNASSDDTEANDRKCKQFSETSLPGALYSEFREFVRILMTDLGKST